MKAVLIFCFALISLIAPRHANADVKLLENAPTNQIQLLDNRFRIDHKVKSVTLLFFRQAGSPAVVLVQPDGSKLYVTDALRNEQLHWFDETSYDLIVIKNPMAGPWQVVGQILPKSKVMVMGEITLEVEPLPQLIFQGETIKLTGRVKNNGNPIEVGAFRDVVDIEVDFVSTNNKAYANFGADTQQVAEFKDDGRGFDERPQDTVFTGEFKLDFTAGQWQPVITLKTPLFKRKIEQAPVELSVPPLQYKVQLSEDKTESHLLSITLDEKQVKPHTVLLQGRIYYPNNEEQTFSIPSQASNLRQLKIGNYQWGHYSIELQLFGTSINGREFMARLPTYTFVMDKPIEPVPAQEATQSAIAALPPLPAPPPPEPKLSDGLFYSLVVFGNLTLFLLGWLLIRVFVQNKPLRFTFGKRDKGQSEKVKTENPDENGSKNDKSDEILNLSMSDE